MARRITLLGLVLVSLVCCSRRDRSETTEVIAPPATEPGEPAPVAVEDVHLEPLDLSAAGLAVILHAPGDAVARTRFLSVQVEVEDGSFALVVDTTTASLTDRKHVIAANDENRLSEYIVNEADAILYESRYQDELEYHVLVHRAIGDHVYECQDRKGQRFTLPQAQTILQACRSLAARPGGS